MPASGNVTVAGAISGGPDGARTFGPMSTNISNAVDETLIVSLSVGSNTVTVPSGTTVAVITPPNAPYPTPNPPYGGTLTLKGASGDTGIVISNYMPTMLNWAGSVLGQPAPPANFVINASVAGTITVWFA